MNTGKDQTIPSKGFLSTKEIRATLELSLSGHFSGEKVLVLIPDHTRSLPLPKLFHMLLEVLEDASQLDFMVALGTHPPLSEESLKKLVGLDDASGNRNLLLNHRWNDPSSLFTLGVMKDDEIRDIAGKHWHSSLPRTVEIRLNKTILNYDHVIILGTTFPHEVVGFSGGAKYFFPGISGSEMIDATHWLGALAGVTGTIGIKDTPVRAMIHRAAQMLSMPVTLIALVTEGQDLAGLFVGDLFEAWSQAADLSAQRHIRWFRKPFQRVLSCAPVMYDELWTAAKAMYKLEPAVDVGGEVIIYAPHLDEVSRVYGNYIKEIGYHTLPYFLANWEKFWNIPLGVLAHSTHLRGSGVTEDGREKPNVRVTLASKISPEDCAFLNLGYQDPSSINISEWMDREDEGILYVPKAGEVLYRVR